jgi:hypothetical protein
MTDEVAVGAVMKANQSNINGGVYKLNSYALEVALRRYEPASS